MIVNDDPKQNASVMSPVTPLEKMLSRMSWLADHL